MVTPDTQTRDPRRRCICRDARPDASSATVHRPTTRGGGSLTTHTAWGCGWGPLVWVRPHGERRARGSAVYAYLTCRKRAPFQPCRMMSTRHASHRHHVLLCAAGVKLVQPRCSRLRSPLWQPQGAGQAWVRGGVRSRRARRLPGYTRLVVAARCVVC